ncbi:MAG: VOC family protein [Sandaracinaceae bacterium]|nr:VOC family protein [Sandaracinaceae bacterium]
MTKTASHTGHVIWRELMTGDLEGAKGFYGELFGWTFKTMPMPEGTYTLAEVGGKGIGGMMPQPPNMKMPPMWTSYVSVPDTDAACAAASANGGKVVFGPVTMEGVGRMATVLDFDMAALAVMTPAGPDEKPGRPALHTFCWETLSTSDVARAHTFYGAVCGWKPGNGSMGMPVLAAADGSDVCDVQTAEGRPPSWLTYVVVESLEASNAKAAKMGGKVMMPRIDIPKVGSISVISDPQGAFLGLFVPSMG